MIAPLIFFAGYVVWGMLFSVQPPFYPGEAEKKGATPAQVGKHKNIFPQKCTKKYNFTHFKVRLRVRHRPHGRHAGSPGLCSLRREDRAEESLPNRLAIFLKEKLPEFPLK